MAVGKGSHLIYPVDYKRLTDALTKRNLRPDEVSLSIGHTASYLFHVSDTGTLRKPAIASLDAMFNIKYDEIKPLTKEEEKIKTNEETVSQTVLSCVEERTAGIDLAPLTDAVNQLAKIIKARSEAQYEHEQRMEAMIHNLLETFLDEGKMYKMIFMPIFNAMKVAEADAQSRDGIDLKATRRIDGTPRK